MKLKILGSGSSGNCYILEGKEETLILEAGLTYKKIQEGLNYDTRKVKGCLISHEHGDHSKAVKDLIKNGIDIYMSNGTIKALELEEGHRVNSLAPGRLEEVGGFKVLPFDTKHDALEPLGFLVQHKEMGKLLFITDSYYSKYRFKDVDHMLVECNYKKSILKENINNGIITNWLGERIMKSHFELDNVKEFLKTSDLDKTKNIVLIHLSSQNSDRKLFKEEIERATGRQTFVASKGLEIDISKELF